MTMATPKQSTDVPTDNQPELPDDWEVAPDADYSELAAWLHSVTGLRVSVRRDRRPTQMHTPETSTDDTGFIAHVRGEYGGRLTARLASKECSYEAAIRFMAEYPAGEFEVPHPSNRAGGQLEWER